MFNISRSFTETHLVVVKCFFIKLPWPGDSEETFRCSIQTATCLPVYHTRWRLQTVLFCDRTFSKEAMNTNFCHIWFDQTWNQTQAHCFIRFIHSTKIWFWSKDCWFWFDYRTGKESLSPQKRLFYFDYYPIEDPMKHFNRSGDAYLQKT